MKKIIVVCLFFLLFIGNVRAAEGNKLYFTEDAKELVYDTDLFDEDVFMHHLDLYPSKQNKDILSIENGSDNTCTLYFKVVEREQSELADELIDNIMMKIYVDDALIYDGSARGEDVTGDKINLQDTITLGTFEPGKVSELISVTKLNEQYDNKNNTVKAYIDWQFYAQCGKEEVLPINPDTGDFMNSKLFVILIVVIIMALLVFVYAKNKMKVRK